MDLFGTEGPLFIEATWKVWSPTTVSFIVKTSGAKVILHDQAEYWLACVKHPGLLSCGMPRGSAYEPVGKGMSPTGVEMGTASKSDPFWPMTWGCLERVSECSKMGPLQHLRFVGRVLGALRVRIIVILLCNKSTDGCTKSNSKD